jgi:hypothetical protein
MIALRRDPNGAPYPVDLLPADDPRQRCPDIT